MLSSVPTLPLNRPGPVASLLRALVDTGAAPAHVPRDNPRVSGQPLDFHDVCQQTRASVQVFRTFAVPGLRREAAIPRDFAEDLSCAAP
ncbi:MULTISPECIES: hypothetical protein [unclassified Burkholderia]|uniref:hypothetical protein n=1 Tax=unclassified Burkholderia TaxID=2613784 RepID=UPI0016292F52|nr:MULTISPECIES: hypothetical protein [unclassified Burkholderia]